MKPFKMTKFGAILLSLIMAFTFLSCHKKPKENICLDLLGTWIHVTPKLFQDSIREAAMFISGDTSFLIYGRIRKEKINEAIKYLTEHRQEIYLGNLDTDRHLLSIEFDYDFYYTATYDAYKDGYYHNNYEYICTGDTIRLDVRGLFIDRHYEYKSILFNSDGILVLMDEESCCIEIFLKKE